MVVLVVVPCILRVLPVVVVLLAGVVVLLVLARPFAIGVVVGDGMGIDMGGGRRWMDGGGRKKGCAVARRTLPDDT